VREGTVHRPVSVLDIRVRQPEQFCLYSGMESGRRDEEGMVSGKWRLKRGFTDVRRE
jgi:hypothetical protein